MKIWGLVFLFISIHAGAADTYTLATKLNTDTGDFDSLASILALPNSQTLNGFLAEWKKAKPEFYSHYVAAYRSRSLQQADRSNPRIIMFNKNADLSLSFNGHPQYRGYSQIEMLRFNHSTNAFEFYELSFENGRAHLSDPNPKKCLECHQSSSRSNVDPRPNWEPYSVWLGFYGSLDDATDLFKSSFTRSKYYRPETDAFLLDDFEKESQWYDEFFYGSAIQTHPRYSLLDTIINENYSDERTINGDYTNRLATLNFRRVARLMKENSNVYEKVKWTVYGYAKCGQTFFVGKDVFEWLKQITPRKELVRRDPPVLPFPPLCPSALKLEGGCGPNNPPILPPVIQYPTVENADVINLMSEPFGIDTEDWSMDFKSEARFAFAERFGVTNDPRPPFNEAFKTVFGDDPDLKNLSCDQLKAKSLETFGQLDSAKAVQKELLALAPEKKPIKPLLERCIRCHVESPRADGPPFLPFNDAQMLKEWLKKPGYKRGTLMDEILYRTGSYAEESEQMPPRGIPTISERNSLLEYLRSL